MSGYLLILAIICLGGAIATIGDRLGSRVGKARLSLFKMRPKQTAVLVTILTGSVISTLTLGILLATNGTLRDGLIRIDEINRKSRLAQSELKEANKQKEAIERELKQAQTSLDTIVDRLRSVRSSLRQAIQKQKAGARKLEELQARFNQAQSQLQQTQSQTQGLRTQLTELERTSRQLETSVNTAQTRLNAAERQKQQLEKAIASSETELNLAKTKEAQSRQALSDAESQLARASDQRTTLQREIQDLEENRQRLEQNVLNLLVGLRQGSIAIRAGQVLSSDIIEDVNNSEQAIQAINRLLGQARIEAIVRIDPPDADQNRAVIFIAPELVERMVNTLSDGQAYFVRVLSANNYFAGEGNISVAVIPQVLPNRKIFPAGEALSAIEFVPTQLNEEEVISKVESLFVRAKQSAVQSGLPPDPLTGDIGVFNTFKLFKFATALKLGNFSEPVQVFAVVKNDTFTADSLQLELVAVQNNEVLLRSN